MPRKVFGSEQFEVPYKENPAVTYADMQQVDASGNTIGITKLYLTADLHKTPTPAPSALMDTIQHDNGTSRNVPKRKETK